MKNFATMFTCLLVLLVTSTKCQDTNKVIFVSLDGFRHDYMEMAKNQNRNVSAFDKIWEMGFRAKVDNVMVTLTFPSHYSMVTGRHTENHGLVGNQFFDPIMKYKYKYTEKKHSMEPRFYEYNDTEPIWLTNQRHGKRSGVFYWPGSDARIKDKMAFATYGLYKDDTNFKYRVDRIMDWITRPEFNLCLLYYNEPDHTGHAYGPDSKEVMDALELVNDGIAYLMQRIESNELLKGKVNLIVGSDHGMATVDPVTRTVKVYDYYTFNDYFGDTSPATLGIWPKNESRTQEMYEKLQGLKNAKVYLKKDIPEEYQMRDNHRIAPIYIIADPGYLIMTSNKPYKNLLGMHGYDNKDPEMKPNLLAMGPDIKHFGKDIQQFYQVDYYPLICALLKLNKPNIIDGKLERVLPFLVTKPGESFIEEFNQYANGLQKL